VEFQARFRHENIAELYGAVLCDQSVHLFMEAGEGGSVLEKLDSCGPMREFEIIWVTKQVLRGLEFLHSHNVIHHDIKRESQIFFFFFFYTCSVLSMAERYYSKLILLVQEIMQGQCLPSLWPNQAAGGAALVNNSGES